MKAFSCAQFQLAGTRCETETPPQQRSGGCHHSSNETLKTEADNISEAGK